jgi:hypothetical protein
MAPVIAATTSTAAVRRRRRPGRTPGAANAVGDLERRRVGWWPSAEPALAQLLDQQGTWVNLGPRRRGGRLIQQHDLRLAEGDRATATC